MIPRAFVVIVSVCLILAAGAPAQVENDWTGNVSDTWFSGPNWSEMHIPLDTEDVKHLSGTTLHADIMAIADTAVAKTFEGQLGASNRTLTLGGTLFEEAGNLFTVGNVYRTGTGTTTYTVDIGLLSQLLVGFQSGTQDADLYGFRLVFNGTLPSNNAVAQATRIIGYGPVELTGSHMGSIQAGNGTQSFPGTIDCAYPIANPIVDSLWRIGNGALYSFTIQSGTVKNVGDWIFRETESPETTRITTNIFDMYENGGKIETWRTRFQINNFNFPAAGFPAPLMKFDGTSQWLYGLAGDNSVHFLPVNAGLANAATLTFSDAAALVRPTSYPTAPLTSPSLILSPDANSTVCDVQSKVARDALAFDTALADWSLDRTHVILKAYTPDICNVEFIDFVLDVGNETVSCFPKHNRCVKYWNNFFTLGNAKLTTQDIPDNQDPDYVPANYPDEAYYFCDFKVDPGFILENPAGLRLYTRLSNSDAAPLVIKLAMTRYMDADADFDVDLVDFSRFQNSFTSEGLVPGPGDRATWFPLADFGTTGTDPTADCDADLEDYKVLRNRWHTNDPGTPQTFRVCTAPPSENLGLPNGSPNTLVCGGPIHQIPTGTPAVPALDCPNCRMVPLSCCDAAGTDVPCPWTAGLPVNPDGRFSIAVVDQEACSKCVSVREGGTVNYKIIGLLHGNPPPDDGLALWGASLAMSGPALVALPQASAPAGMSTFAVPDGVNNPAGYGGTPFNDALLQIGGAQNTIKNHIGNAPFPIGSVVGDVAHVWTTLAEGSVDMPSTAGVYILELSDVFANVILDGEMSGTPPYLHTERVDVRSVQNLRIRVGLDDTVSIVEANPPLESPYVPGNVFRDVLQDGYMVTPPEPDPPYFVPQGIGGVGTPDEGIAPDIITYAPIRVTFSAAPVPALMPVHIDVSCSYTDSTAPIMTVCPDVDTVTGSGSGPYSITLTGPIPPGGCTTITFTQSCNVLRYEYLPGDVNLDGRANTEDLLWLVQRLNDGTANVPANWARYNINRDHLSSTPVNTQDPLRLVQLLDGVNTTQVWSGFEVLPCAPDPVCGGSDFAGGGGSAPSGAGGDSAGGAGDSGPTPEEIALITLQVQTACAADGIDPVQCQEWIDNLFGAQP